MSRERWIEAAFKVGPFGDDDLRVASYRWIETLSGPFELEVEFGRVDKAPMDAASLVAAEARLALRAPDAPERHVHGIVERVEFLPDDPRSPMCRARVVPRLRRLEHVRRNRIFQDLSVPDIAKKVLDAAKVEQRWSLQGSYPAREYCVQYGESDLAFVQRLLEEDGIFYFFEHRDDGHVMVLGDHAKAFAALAGGPEVKFRFRSGHVEEEEHVYALAQEDRLAPGAAVLRDFDFEKPALDLTASAEARDAESELEWYEYPGLYTSPGDGKRLGRTRIEELRSVARTRRGESTCRCIAPGFALEVREHPEAAFNEKLVAVRVEHAGVQQDSPGAGATVDDAYRNAFVAIPDGTPFRPLRKTPRPLIAGVQTATVVGPAGEEIFTDKHGRVKVQFHWDRDGKRDERSSCWVRLAQTWAGPGLGALLVPRIGQEVVVRFLEGNPDRPLVIGAVYNGAHPPAVALPGAKTKSTLRSASSPGSAGANELSLEDAGGSEQVMLHAQKDATFKVENDKGQKVGNDESLSVTADRSRKVGGDQTAKVAKDDGSTIGKDQALQVRGNRATTVARDHSESVDGAQSVKVNGTQSVTVALASMANVGAAAALTIGAAYGIQVVGAVNHAVGGLKSTLVGGASITKVGAHRSEQIAKNSATRVGAGSETSAGRNATLATEKDVKEDVTGKTEVTVTDAAGSSAKSFKLEADTLTVKVGGDVRFKLAKSGKIEVSGNEITFDGSDIALKGSKIKLDR